MGGHQIRSVGANSEGAARESQPGVDTTQERRRKVEGKRGKYLLGNIYVVYDLSGREEEASIHSAKRKKGDEKAGLARE